MASLIRLKQIESGSALQTSANVGQDFSQSVINIISGEVVGFLPDGVVSSSVQVELTQTSQYTTFSSSLHTEIVAATNEQDLTSFATKTEVTNLSSSVATAISSSVATITFDSASLEQSILNLSSSFSSSINSVIYGKGIISGSHQLDGTTINNLTLSTIGDAYSLIVSGALAVVDGEVNISGTIYDVPGEIFVNGLTGSAGNPPEKPYTPTGQPDANVLDNGEW